MLLSFFFRSLLLKTNDPESRELCASVLKLWKVTCRGNGKTFLVFFTFLLCHLDGASPRQTVSPIQHEVPWREDKKRTLLSDAFLLVLDSDGVFITAHECSPSIIAELWSEEES